MFYHLKDHIYATQFRDEVILLDTISDRYTICTELVSNTFSKLLNANSNHFQQDLETKHLNCIQMLIDQGIIESKTHPYAFFVDQKTHSLGVSNVDWRLPVADKKVRLKAQVLSALFILIKINIYMKVKGFNYAINRIKKSHSLKQNYIIPQQAELTELAAILNIACRLYPTRTKCLEWAMTFVLLSLHRGWRCNLEIGVQNYPFYAHAWVECDGKVVMDEQHLRDGLAIILNEPFRRVSQ